MEGPETLAGRARPVKIRPMTIEDYPAVIGLMADTPGITVRDADSRAATLRYLERNPGLSFVAEEQGAIVGCAMSGHDGRRGYLNHVVVTPARRCQGLAAELVTRCLEELESIGILKTHLDVLVTNEPALGYWTRRGWQKRDEIVRFSTNRSTDPNV